MHCIWNCRKNNYLGNLTQTAGNKNILATVKNIHTRAHSEWPAVSPLSSLCTSSLEIMHNVFPLWTWLSYLLTVSKPLLQILRTRKPRLRKRILEMVVQNETWESILELCCLLVVKQLLVMRRMSQELCILVYSAVPHRAPTSTWFGSIQLVR